MLYLQSNKYGNSLFDMEPISSPKEKQIIVVFRYDDYSSCSSTDLELKIINAFQKYYVSCTFGVIPHVYTSNIYNTSAHDMVYLTSGKINILSKLFKNGTWDVALHGYAHQPVLKRLGGGYTEFYGLDYNSQRKRLVEGKKLLELFLGRQITTFIPPWNSYDLNTMQILEDIGFTCISADLFGESKKSSRLKFLPATCNLSELRDTVEIARKNLDLQPIIVVCFHDYEFLEVNRAEGKLRYQDFIEILDWIACQKDVKVNTIQQTAEVITDLSAHRFINNKMVYYNMRITPHFLHKTYSSNIYFSLNVVCGKKIKNSVFKSLFYVIINVIKLRIFFKSSLNYCMRNRNDVYYCL